MRAGCILAVLLLAACAGAPSAPGSPPMTPALTPGATSAATPGATPADDVRLLASGLGGDFDDPFSVASATDEDEWGALWARLSASGPRPRVDLDQAIVVYFGMAGSSSCPERFERLVVDDTLRVYAEWSRPPGNQPCTDDLAPQGVLLAVSRAVLPSEPFTLSLRGQPVCADCPDRPDQVVVDPR